MGPSRLIPHLCIISGKGASSHPTGVRWIPQEGFLQHKAVHVESAMRSRGISEITLWSIILLLLPSLLTRKPAFIFIFLPARNDSKSWKIALFSEQPKPAAVTPSFLSPIFHLANWQQLQPVHCRENSCHTSQTTPYLFAVLVFWGGCFHF